MGSARRARGREGGSVLKGAAAGLVGGLVASLVMNEFQALWSNVSEGMKGSQGDNSSGLGGQQPTGSEQPAGGGDEGQEPATVKAAEAISEGVFGHVLTKDEKPAAGEAVHYAMGGTSGAVYGALAEFLPAVTAGAGVPFGAAVWLVADEAAVPALGLSEAPTEYPLSTHAYALASHFVYGLTTEAVRRGVRSLL